MANERKEKTVTTERLILNIVVVAVVVCAVVFGIVGLGSSLVPLWK